MAATLEELEQRVLALEAEVRALRTRLESAPAEETPAQRSERLSRGAQAGKNSEEGVSLKEVLRQLGITGKPIGAERVQEIMVAEGVKPEDCVLSREILAMREE